MSHKETHPILLQIAATAQLCHTTRVVEVSKLAIRPFKIAFVLIV